MRACYIDESGGTEAPDQASDATPVFVVAGLMLDTDDLPALTRDYIALKVKFFPAKFSTSKSLDQILTEVKGTQILGLTRDTSRNKRRHASRFRDELLYLLNRYQIRLVAHVHVKTDGQSIDGRNIYGYAVQDICQHFNQYLQQANDYGLVIADSREHKLNSQVAHSVFTQRWRAGGDAYPRLIEIPVFAASDNHVGLQLVDMIATAFVFPLAVSAYCPERTNYVHNPSKYSKVREDYGNRLKETIFRYKFGRSRVQGGISVKGVGAGRSARDIYGPTPIS